MVKISNFIISLALVGLVMGGFGIFFNQVSYNYAVVYDNSSLDDYNHIQAIYNNTNEMKDSATKIDPNPNPLAELVSVIDGFFTGAYNTLVLAWKSFDIFDSVSDGVIDNSGVESGFASLFKTTVLIIVTVLLIMGVIVRAIVKSEV